MLPFSNLSSTVEKSSVWPEAAPEAEEVPAAEEASDAGADDEAALPADEAFPPEAHAVNSTAPARAAARAHAMVLVCLEVFINRSSCFAYLSERRPSGAE
jgi:hypothetical protein